MKNSVSVNRWEMSGSDRVVQLLLLDSVGKGEVVKSPTTVAKSPVAHLVRIAQRLALLHPVLV